MFYQKYNTLPASTQLGFFYKEFLKYPWLNAVDDIPCGDDEVGCTYGEEDLTEPSVKAGCASRRRGDNGGGVDASELGMLS